MNEHGATSRRRFLTRLSGAGAGLLALACQPSTAQAPTVAPAKPAEAKPTEAPKPAAQPTAAAAKPAEAVAAAPTSAASAAATAPPGPIEAVVAAGAGGSSDVLMRRLADIMTKEGFVPQTLVVQPRPGGSGAVAFNYMLEKKADPNVIGLVAGTLITTPINRGTPLLYNQIVPLAMLIEMDLTVVAAASSPYHTLEDVIAAAKQKPGEVKLGGAQVGSTDHIVTLKINQATGAEINYIGFSAGAEAIPQMLGGTIDLVVLNPDEALPLAEGGQARMLGLLSDSRLQADDMKDVPTAKEQGIDLSYSQYWGLGAPPGTAPGIVAWWDDVIARMVRSDPYKTFMEENYFRDIYQDSAQSLAFLERWHQKELEVLKSIGLAKQ